MNDKNYDRKICHGNPANSLVVVIHSLGPSLVFKKKSHTDHPFIKRIKICNVCGSMF